MSRQDLLFASGADSCAAWLYPARASVYPAGNGGEVPMVVMAHGLSGTRRDRLGAFADRFAAEGFAALVFDHRGFGDSTGEPDRFEPARQLADWHAAIAFARSLDGIHDDGIVTFGSSIGGGNALAAAAEDPRVAAAISQVPFLDMAGQAHRSPPDVVAQMRSAANAGQHLPAVGQPHEPAFINAHGAEAGWRHVVAIGEDSRWRNRVSASWLLGEPYRPARYAETLHCPWLVCVGEADQVAKPGPAVEAAHRAPFGELRTYPGVDHFDIYDGPQHEAVMTDEIAFLVRHLLSAPR
jgi:pimeloyl-ACP methyl ester carboxylesterase